MNCFTGIVVIGKSTIKEIRKFESDKTDDVAAVSFFACKIWNFAMYVLGFCNPIIQFYLANISLIVEPQGLKSKVVWFSKFC